jgi:uncharacterized membrane protein YqhA
LLLPGKKMKTAIPASRITCVLVGLVVAFVALANLFFHTAIKEVAQVFF